LENIDFPDFDSFIKDLGTWLVYLKDFAESYNMKSIYNFVKSEYKSKTVK
jgi:hypothetical protein